MFYYLVLFLLFLLPFVYLPLGASYFEAPKVYAAELGIFILLLITIWRGKRLFTKKNKLAFFCLGLLFLLSLLHVLFSATDYTIWGNQFRMQGTFLLWFLLIFCWLSAAEPLKRIPFLFVFICFILQTILAVWVSSGTLGRAIGSLGEPNSLAGVMIFLWPFLYFSVGKNRRRLVFMVIFLLMAVILLLSGSRSGMIAYALQLIFLFLLTFTKLSFKKTTVICLILLALSYGFPFIDRGSLYENRGEVWQTAFVAGMRHPLVGNGFGNVEVVLHDTALKLNNHLPGYYVDSSHNIFLDWWVQAGIVGVGVLVFLLRQAGMRFIRKKSVRNMLVLLGVLGVLSFNPVSVCLLVAFWWIIGQGM